MTWRSLLALILAAVVFIPVSTYTYLLMGTALGMVSIFFVTLLFTEIARLTYAELTKQETLIVYYGSAIGGAVSTVYFLVVYRSYFVHSPFAWSASIGGKPLALLVPSWLTPPLDSPAHHLRNLFHPDFLPVVSLYTTMLALTLIADLGLAMLMARIFVEEEAYRFPFAEVDASIITFISERPPETTMYLLLSMIPGVLWATVALASPALVGIRVFPIPFLDLTWFIQEYLPGAVFGFSTVLSSYFSGMIVPFTSAVYTLAASIVVWMVLNSLFITTFPDVFPEWSREYFKGMGLINVMNRSFVRVWFAPQIGFGLAAALLLALASRRGIVAAVRGFLRPSRTTSSILNFPSNRVCILMFLIPGLIQVVLFHYLVPEVDIWVPVVAWLVYSFLLGIVLTAMQGEVGFFMAPGFVWQTLVSLTRYEGYAGFVYQVTQPGMLSPTFSQQVKVALATETDPLDLVRLQIVANTLSWIIGLISLSVFWLMAPIPSSAYPFTVYNMPLTAQIDVVTTTRQVRISAEYILLPAGILMGIVLALQALSKVGLPFSAPGLFLGLFMPPVTAIPLFIGSALGRFLMPRIFGGREKWMRARGYVVAGEALGEGAIIMILMSAALLSKASWIWPW